MSATTIASGLSRHAMVTAVESVLLSDRVTRLGDLATAGDPAHVVHLHGEHDLASAVDLAAMLITASNAPGDLIVDMSEVTFFDASTIHVLVGVRLDLEAGGRHLWLRAPTPWGRRILDVCSMTALIEPSTDPVDA